MTNGGQRPDPSGFRIENEMDLLFGRAHPNPTRVGCPPPELLKSLARRELPIDDPAYDHFAKCSPCYQELRALQQADAATAATVKRRRTMLAAAAILALAVAGSWFVFRQTDDTRPAAPSTAQATQVASLDLRPLAVTRSDEQKAAAVPLEIPRGRVNATILLPVGSSPGAYELRILDGDLRVRASAKGSAEIRNFITTLEAAIDASPLDAAQYQLTLRREGGEWQMFPLRVR
jgi:hypothetical protein